MSSGISYSKWDNFKDSDEEDADASSDIRAPTDLGLPKAKLITLPWDPYCEEVRWALTRHGVPFIEDAYPWPLNYIAAIDYSDPMPHKQQTHVPVFINYKNEVYKRSTADIFLFLYAHSFNTSLKVYSEPDALVLQEMLGKVLAPAVTTIFLSIVLSDSTLTQKYLLDSIHLNTHSAIVHTFWPFLKRLLGYVYNTSTKNVDHAWDIVDGIFKLIERELLKNENKYISASTFTASDIAFAAHAAFVLFPNKEEDGESGSRGLGFKLPCLKELAASSNSTTQNLVTKIIKLRETAAGKHALRMYKTERVYSSRPDGYRSFPSKFSKENNPWWAKEHDGAILTQYTYTALFAYVLLWIWVATSRQAIMLFLIAQVTFLALGYHRFVLPTVWHKRVQQILFQLRGKFEPTERDKVEAEQAIKDKAMQNGIKEEEKVVATKKVKNNELNFSQRRLADTINQIRAIEIKGIKDKNKAGRMKRDSELQLQGFYASTKIPLRKKLPRIRVLALTSTLSIMSSLQRGQRKQASALAKAQQ
ncbi:UNVERIFIED_CONTAM: hypothetical protein HDU68_003727 [Siphonaria sp. JEL0065]|nr:hypothetical protein HDU68_003727 [Siphonaria sp. JEL0065]